jgi:serine/tyrosine/threonine adenylyltransferase
MNAPLPPLSHHPAPGTAPRAAWLDEALQDKWSPGFAALAGDEDEPFTRPCDPLPMEQVSGTVSGTMSGTQWLAISKKACELIGVDAGRIAVNPDWLAVMSGNAAPAHFQPYAAVYAGHQFGVFVPRLGDGRALNLGALNGWELQLKGAGPTPYARFADGRAVLRSSIREFLCSEAMQALGIPTTRALSITLSSLPVMRETMETAAVVCRMSPSFVRFGTFEYFASRGRTDLLEVLVGHVNELLGIATGASPPRNDIHVTARAPEEPVAVHAIQMLHEVSRRTARLMAQWMGAGFMHGVMNTDNFSILGMTIDYGPYGFMDGFDANHICNHSDYAGRYAYAAQPQVGLWNVAKLINALYPLVKDTDRLQAVIETYKATYAASMQEILRTKFGLQQLDEETYTSVTDDFYTLLQTQHIDYTLAFRSLSAANDQAFLDLCLDREAAKPWLARYRQAAQNAARAQGISQSQQAQAMSQVNPKFVLRNWVAEEVIRAVRDDANTKPFEDVFSVLQSPFAEHAELSRYAQTPPAWADHLEVSCSS